MTNTDWKSKKQRETQRYKEKAMKCTLVFFRDYTEKLKMALMPWNEILLMPQQRLIWVRSNAEVGVKMSGTAEDQNSTEGNVTRLSLTGSVFVGRGGFFCALNGFVFIAPQRGLFFVTETTAVQRFMGTPPVRDEVNHTCTDDNHSVTLTCRTTYVVCDA